jgi:hypothetical protein
MYTILVNQDDTLYGSHKERIMQRQKLVNDLVFIVDPIYRDTHDMTDATVMLEYVLPVSREYKTVILTLSDERYNDCFLQYKLPFDTDLTSQAGSLELQLTFAYVEMNENGVGIQRVRKTSSTIIDIIPITAWSDIVPDSALSSLDQRLIKMDAQMRAMNDYLDVIDSNKVDNLVYNEYEDTLQLSANGVGVGNKVSVKDMLDDGIPVVDLDSVSGDTEHDNGCNCGNCGCEDNVVEFGYSSDNIDEPEESTDDDNVVEF